MAADFQLQFLQSLLTGHRGLSQMALIKELRAPWGFVVLWYLMRAYGTDTAQSVTPENSVTSPKALGLVTEFFCTATKCLDAVHSLSPRNLYGEEIFPL